jgi:glutamine synthetase
MSDGTKRLLEQLIEVRKGVEDRIQSGTAEGYHAKAATKLTEIVELLGGGESPGPSATVSVGGAASGAASSTSMTAGGATAAATVTGISEKGTKMSTANEVISQLKANDVKFVDLRFTDTKGKMQHLTMDVGLIDADAFTDGVPFDGSSIAGWKAINESDMLLMLDPATAHIDPFYGQKTMAIFCDVLEPNTGERFDRDPRGIAHKAEAYLKSTGIGDSCYFGPEAEFFMFDDVRFSATPYNTGFKLDDVELPSNTDRAYESGNLGHRPRTKGGYFPVNPVDSCQDIRSEMVSVMAAMGVPVEKHHHEVAAAQHECGIKYDSLVRSADNLQVYKYVVHNVAEAYGKTATFMPKPIFGDNGSGMHVHQSIWKAGQPVFAGNKYADLSQECLWYIGGILKHAKSLNAFTNPLTNSYKRLVPGYEAPVLLAYSARNRSASCRIPHVSSPKGKRIEIRFPDAGANPYLAFAAMLMAGLDGIENKIDPGSAMDKDLYDLPRAELLQIPTVCGSLREAMASLAADHAYLTKGGVFSEDMINAYIELKAPEIDRVDMTPHPIEFDFYYSV